MHTASNRTRAFLQTSEITRPVYIKPPREAGLHHSKVWKLLKPAYGMLDAAHSFYLNFAEGLISQNMEVNRMDNAMFLMYSDKSKPGDDHRQPEGMLGAHVDDAPGQAHEDLGRVERHGSSPRASGAQASSRGSAISHV